MFFIFTIVLITFLLSVFLKNEKASNTFFDFFIITFAASLAMLVMDISLAIGLNNKSEEIINQYKEEHENYLLEYGLYTEETHKFLDYIFYNKEFIYVSMNSSDLKENEIMLEELLDFEAFIKKESIKRKLLIQLDDENIFLNIKEINTGNYNIKQNRQIKTIN